jgi:hypothetical protein
MKGGEGEVQTERPFLACLQEFRNYWGNSEVLEGKSSRRLTGLDKTLDPGNAVLKPSDSRDVTENAESIDKNIVHRTHNYRLLSGVRYQSVITARKLELLFSGLSTYR